MKLVRADIKNFRSIKEESINFNPSCRVLVGINESGKSSVLNALATLSSDFKTTTSDERQQLPDENEASDEARIRFIFNMDKIDYDKMLGELYSKIEAPIGAKAVNDGEKDYSISKLLKQLKEGIYRVDIQKSSKHAQCWTKDIPDTYTLAGEWKKPSSECPPDFTYTNSAGKQITLSKMHLLKLGEDNFGIPEEYLTDASPIDVRTLIINTFCAYIEDNLPRVIFWKYSAKDLLPNQINLAKFTQSPDDYLPLKNMFLLAGREDIVTEINNAKKRGAYALDNLLTSVSLKATQYLEEVWKEYKGVKFGLQMNGPNIQCTVTEENAFSFKDRSDGFKKFIAFLLSVSTTTHTNSLQDALILIDEPETGLHPSGARYLRDELLKISKKNLVIYSTHSIFMIDRHAIERHLIASKTREITTLKQADEGNVVHEEVIFNAINYSTFEHLKEMNVLFEGRWDRRLFEVFTKSYKNNYFSNIGIVHGRGVASFRALVPTLELAERKAVIVSDNDKAARDAQRHYETDLDYRTKWLTYRQITSSSTALTGEDFLKKSYVATEFNKLCSTRGITLSVVDTNLPDDDKLDYLKKQLVKVGRAHEDIKEDITLLKKNLFDNLTKAKIEECYKDLVDDIKEYLDKL